MQGFKAILDEEYVEVPISFTTTADEEKKTIMSLLFFIINLEIFFSKLKLKILN